MALNFGRGQGNAEITIDRQKCTVCGLCVSVCKGAPLYIQDGELRVDQGLLFGCIGCGHCMAICPNTAIKVEGRDLSFDDTYLLAPKKELPTYDEFLKLLQSRRSVRVFQERDVESELIEKIIQAAATAPMGLPPSEVGVVVLSGRQKVAELKDALLELIKGIRPYFSPFMLALMRPFMSKEDYQGMQQFVAPALNFYIEDVKTGRDWFFYDAPLAMCFNATAFADPADVYIAATYAMMAGQALGLGTCMLGFPMMLVRYSDKIRKQFHFPAKMRSGLVVIFGYPAVNYRRGISRRFANVEILK
jgi:ferredoxin